MMLLSVLLSCVPLIQGPGAVVPGPAENLDVIVLENGERFEGRITTELDGYVEFQLDHGAIVGIARKRIAKIVRGGGERIAAVAVPLAPRDEWFVLHDAEGSAVGWLHATVTIADDGTVTASEEYEFAEGGERYQVTSTCTADASLTPRRCYFRERRSEPVHGIALPGVEAAARPDRVVDERIVEACCEGDDLTVMRIDGSGREERRYAWQGGVTFPLLARAMARANGSPVEPSEMFDPATEEISVRGVEGGRRRAVSIGGRLQHVLEIVESGSHTPNSEWLDASMKTLRREIAGPALVAVPSTARDVRGQVGRAKIAPALARESEGTFGLWIPNPAWVVEPELGAGRIVLACAAHGASIGLVRMDHLDAGIRIEAAADAVANWFHLLQPDLSVQRREPALTRGRRGVCLIAEGRVAGKELRATVTVVPDGEGFFVLTCRAPVTAWDELSADFAFALRTIEFEAQSVAPEMQGPLRPRQQARRSQSRR